MFLACSMPEPARSVSHMCVCVCVCVYKFFLNTISLAQISSSPSALIQGSLRCFQGAYIVKIIFILLNLYLPKLSYSHESMVEFSKNQMTCYDVKFKQNACSYYIFLCFADLSKVSSLRYTYVHCQRLSLFVSQFPLCYQLSLVISA